MPVTTLCQADNAVGFLRGELALPVQGSREAFLFGVWVSLEPEDLALYLEAQAPERPLHGWLASSLPGMDEAAAGEDAAAPRGIRARIYPRPDGGPPAVVLDHDDHPLVRGLGFGIEPARLDGLAHPQP